MGRGSKAWNGEQHTAFGRAHRTQESALATRRIMLPRNISWIAISMIPDYAASIRSEYSQP
jgi:hypothetical protein